MSEYAPTSLYKYLETDTLQNLQISPKESVVI